MKLWNICARTAWLSAVALLAGCVTAPISGERKLTGDEGAVVFKLITNGATNFDPAETLSSITLKRDVPEGAKESSMDSPVLTRTRATTSTTAIFSGMVPPGRYRVVQGNGYQGNTTYTFPMQRMLTPFEVKKGEVSLLGTLLVQPLQGNRFTVGYVPPETELKGTFDVLFPALSQQTQDQAANTFESSAELRQRQQLAERVRRSDGAYTGARALADGSVVAASKMGRVLWRRPADSRWRSLQIDTWKEVLSVAIYRGGLLAAGEEGLLRYSSDEGATWRSLTAPSQGLIAAAEPLPNGKVIALVRRDTEWTAYVSDDVLAGAWRKVGSFEDERSLNVPWQKPIAVASGNHVGIIMPNGEIRIVDGVTEAIERRSTGVSTFGAQAMRDGTLVVRGGTMTPSTLVSSDAGKTWTDLKTGRFVQAIAFADARTSYAIAPVDPGLFAGNFALMASRDGAKTWTQTGEVPGGLPFATRTLLFDRSDNSLLAFMLDGRVLRSTDEGKSWERSF